ncbi:MAG: Type secretion system pilin [Candidatus Parcubacteria bacterium]|jgi:hypothetical protein
MKYIYTIVFCLILSLFINFNFTNAQLTPSPSKTQCPTCPQGQQCIKKADGFLECRVIATDCKKNDGSAGCGANQACVKATSTSTIGQCVADAPASAKTALASNNSGASQGGSSAGGSGGLLGGLNEFKGAESGLNTESTLIEYIANIIRWILGLLGTVFFVVIVLQGYIYMTAGGDSGKTASAISAITNAVIGLAIVMAAFLITNYVTSALVSLG